MQVEADLLRLGHLFQQAVQEVLPRLGAGWKSFPAGACWDASQVFASWLRGKGYVVTVWSVEKPERGIVWSHVWCEVDGWHVDVTHGQLDPLVPLLVAKQPTQAVRGLKATTVLPLETYGFPGPFIGAEQREIKKHLSELESV